MHYIFPMSQQSVPTGMWRSRAVAATMMEHRPSDCSWFGAWWKVDAATSARMAARRRDRNVRSSACRSSCAGRLIVRSGSFEVGVGVGVSLQVMLRGMGTVTVEDGVRATLGFRLSHARG